VAGTEVTLEGGDTFNRTTKDVARGLADMTDVNRKAAEAVLRRADPKTPRSSGALAATGRVDAGPTEAAVTYDAIYAGVIHNGWADRNIEPQPWLIETFDQSVSEVTDVYAEGIDDRLSTIKGK
jgi:hypothetical protein